MGFDFWIIKATDRHSQYEIRLAFARQQLLRERAAMLRDMYITSIARQ